MKDFLGQELKKDDYIVISEKYGGFNYAKIFDIKSNKVEFEYYNYYGLKIEINTTHKINPNRVIRIDSIPNDLNN